MNYPLLEPARVCAAAAAVVFAALALGVGNPAWGGSSVTEEQADAAAVIERAMDEEAKEQAAVDADRDDGEIDARFVETVIWSEPEDPPAWFPPLDESHPPTLDADALTLTPSPMQTADLSSDALAAAESNIITNEHAVIPLPPAAWTGLAGLASLATIRGRKALIRFFCT